MEGMQAWSASALRAYYDDPVVELRESSHRHGGGATARGAGFYIELHCQPDCCSAVGLPSHIGPFVTTELAQKWSRKNLANVPPAVPRH